jgi:hypothetical protein
MVYNFIMRYINLLITLLLFSLSAHAAIEDREFLNEIFGGCVANEIDMLDAGESFEYCGCVTNIVSKEMDMIEILEMTLEILKESDDMTEDKVERLAIQKLLQNKAITDGMISCLVKVYD